MPRVNIDKQAPSFSLEDFKGKQFSLSRFEGAKKCSVDF